MTEPFPTEIEADIARARRLAWWTIAWMTSIVIVMFLAMGSSQAMRTAFVEDLLSIVPSVVLLIALKLECKEPTRLFPHGYDRAHSIAFLIAATALTIMGATLLFEALRTLAMREHITIPSVFLFGQQVWLGWVMVAALLYSVVPPLILGRMKLPVARRAHDEVLHTDALMQKADWMTGLAGVGGVIGVGLGYWWADAAAAAVISASILQDGVKALRSAAAELADGVPRALGSSDMAADADALAKELKRRWPEGEIRLRESGRYILAEVHGVNPPPGGIDLDSLWPCEPERRWRFAELEFVPPERGAR
ncbi:cation transporter [Sphingosinicella sp. YJ22]|uniref:cation transporter n=1 Tax=Sphingosinicella sp. YJ22 TaxID=1104780 RepID=UPI00140A96A4|nr:cation transporter [Sphingosinicella sp. YJ22]